MIYCPKCGTANEEGSRLCSKCGGLLPHTGVRCPECSAMNPTGNVFCDYCGTRLVPLPAELRERPSAEEDGEERAPQASFKGLSLPTIPLEEAIPSPEPSSPAEESGWLSQLRATVAEEEAEEGAITPLEDQEPVEIPDWLRELDTTAPPAPTVEEVPLPEEAPAEEAGVPDWLRALDTEDTETAPAPPSEETPPPEAVPPEEAEAPDWLRALGIEAPPTLPIEQAPPSAEPPEGVGVPDWLSELDVTAPPAPPIEEAPPPAEPREGIGVPDWLGELEAEAPSVPPAEEVLPEEVEEAEPPQQPEMGAVLDSYAEIPSEEGAIPEWLRELEAEAPSAAPTPPPPEEAGIPQWLLEPEADLAAERVSEGPDTGAAAPVFTLGEGELPIEPGEIPDWLVPMRPEGAAVQPPLAPRQPFPQPAPLVEERLAPAEIPEWLEALRPRPEVGPIEEPLETEGLLEGLRGTLPASPLIEAMGKVEAAAVVTASAATIARAELLQELLSRPVAAPRRGERERKRTTSWTIQRILVNLLLLAAILAPILAEIGGFQLFANEALLPAPGFSEDAQRVYNEIQEQIQSGTSVLVAFEYGPSEADEVDRVAEPLLLHLLGRGAQLIVVSTQPEGPVLAERLGSDLVAHGLLAEEEWAAQVINLGYLPGQAMGIQSVLTDLTGRSEYWSGVSTAEIAALEGISSAEDVALIVVLAGQSTNLQAWVEQTSVLNRRPPLVAGISVRAAPLSRPYLEAEGQLRGVVTGLVEAASYEARIESGSGRATRYLESLTLAHLVVAGLMATGAVIFMFRGKGQ